MSESNDEEMKTRRIWDVIFNSFPCQEEDSLSGSYKREIVCSPDNDDKLCCWHCKDFPTCLENWKLHDTKEEQFIYCHILMRPRWCSACMNKKLGRKEFAKGKSRN